MSKKFNLKWSTNNSKLRKLNTVSFNLPAFRSEDGFAVCPKAGACATLCYARQGHYLGSRARNAREYNLERARQTETFAGRAVFLDMLWNDLKNIPNKNVRVHDSGDFFSQHYLDVWFLVARNFPQKKFYSYTKSLHLDFSKKPSNFTIVQSVGGLMDKDIDKSKSHSRIFVSHADRRKAGYVNGNTNDRPAIRGDIKIGLVYHGVKNLKKGQVRWLREVK